MATEREKEIWRSDTSKKYVFIVINGLDAIGNDRVLKDSLVLTQAIESADILTFEGCIASTLKIGIFGITEDIRGRNIRVSLTAEEGNLSTTETIFTGTVVGQTNLTFDDVITTITCYDKMYSLAKKNISPWYNELEFPIRLGDMFDSFMEYVGLEGDSVRLPLADLEMERHLSSQGLIAKDFLKAVCEASGSYGKIDGFGNFRWVDVYVKGLYPADTLYPADDLFLEGDNYPDYGSSALYRKFTHEAYYTEFIDRVTIRATDTDIGVTAGPGNNAFIVEANLIYNAKGTEELQPYADFLYDKLKDIQYTPFKLETTGAPYVHAGDLIFIQSRTEKFKSIVLERTLKGIQHMTDTYSAAGNQYREQVTTISRKVELLGRKGNELERTVEETRSEIYDEEGMSRITQTAAGLKTVAEDLGKAESSITQNANAIKLRVEKGKVSSEISQEAGEVKIEANRLIINSDHFQLSKTGKITANEAEIIGTITSETGKIGGFTIAKSSLHNGIQSYNSGGVGVYLGLEGINCGGGFRVNNAGAVTANNLTINGYGAVTLNGNPVTMYLTNQGLTFQHASESSWKTDIRYDTVQVGKTAMTTNGITVMTNSQSSTDFSTLTRRALIMGASSVAFAGIYANSTSNPVLQFTDSTLYMRSSKVSIGNSNSTIGFFGSIGVTKRSVAVIPQNNLNLYNLRDVVASIKSALVSYGLVGSQ